MVLTELNKMTDGSDMKDNLITFTASERGLARREKNTPLT